MTRGQQLPILITSGLAGFFAPAIIASLRMRGTKYIISRIWDSLKIYDQDAPINISSLLFL
jgi:hypothetical protein